MQVAVMAAYAALDPIAVALQQGLNGEGLRDRRLHDQRPAGAGMGPVVQQFGQARQVAGLRRQQQVAIIGRAAARADQTDLVIAVPAQPQQRRQPSRAGDIDAGGLVDTGLGEKPAQQAAGRGMLQRGR